VAVYSTTQHCWYHARWHTATLLCSVRRCDEIKIVPTFCVTSGPAPYVLVFSIRGRTLALGVHRCASRARAGMAVPPLPRALTSVVNFKTTADASLNPTDDNPYNSVGFP
jgi:hypothetical protein